MPGPALVAWILFVALATFVAFFYSSVGGTAAPAMPVALVCFALGLWAAPRASFAAGIVMAVEIQLAQGFADGPDLVVLVLTVAPVWLGYQLRRRRETVAELSRRSAELEAAEDAYVRMSVRRERVAIARELHDIVSHHLAVIVVQSGAGRTSSERNPQADRDRFSVIASAGEYALTDMVRLVDILQSPARADDGFARLPRLLAQAAAGGLEVTMSPLPDQLVLPGAVEDVAADVIGESLTNAIKHAPGSRVLVSVAQLESALAVEVSDEGGASASALAVTGAGMGLDGMRERVDAVGGSLTAGDQADGWRVRALIPLPATNPTE
ncbi:MAG: sensor histidine kinase [Solirubrobacterales bacterium]